MKLKESYINQFDDSAGFVVHMVALSRDTVEGRSSQIRAPELRNLSSSFSQAGRLQRPLQWQDRDLATKNSESQTSH